MQKPESSLERIKLLVLSSPRVSAMFQKIKRATRFHHRNRIALATTSPERSGDFISQGGLRQTSSMGIFLKNIFRYRLIRPFTGFLVFAVSETYVSPHSKNCYKSKKLFLICQEGEENIFFLELVKNVFLNKLGNKNIFFMPPHEEQLSYYS